MRPRKIRTASPDVEVPRHMVYYGPIAAAASLQVEPNSLKYWFAMHPSMPNVIVAASLYGYMYTSDDGGDSWEKLRKEFGEVRTLALTPNQSPPYKGEKTVG